MGYIQEGKGDQPESFLESKGFTLELGRRGGLNTQQTVTEEVEKSR